MLHPEGHSRLAHVLARVFEMAGLTTEDRVQNPIGYGLWTAGSGFQRGSKRFGALAIPTGPGNLDLQMEFLVDFQITVNCCTASMACSWRRKWNEAASATRSP